MKLFTNPLTPPFYNPLGDKSGFPQVRNLVSAGRLTRSATFAREGDVATAFNQSGLQDYLANTPRTEYNPANDQLLGLLIEGSQQNLVLQSQNFGDAAWILNSGSIVTGQPDLSGGTSAYLRTENGSSATLRSTNARTILDATTYTDYWIVKRGNLPQWIAVIAGNDTIATNSVIGWFDILNGATGTLSTSGTGWTAVSHNIKDIGDGRYELSITYTSGATTLYKYINSRSADAAATRANIGSGAGIGITYTLYHAQTVLGTYGGSIIPTGASAVTRGLDNARITNLSSFGYRADEGVFSFAFRITNRSAAAPPRVFSLNDGSNDNVIEVYVDNDGCRLQVINSGVSQVNIVGGQFTDGTLVTGAIRYKAGDYAISINGGAEVTSNYNAVPTVDRLQIGNRFGTDRPLNGHLLNQSYIPFGRPLSF